MDWCHRLLALHVVVVVCGSGWLSVVGLHSCPRTHRHCVGFVCILDLIVMAYNISTLCTRQVLASPPPLCTHSTTTTTRYAYSTLLVLFCIMIIHPSIHPSIHMYKQWGVVGECV